MPTRWSAGRLVHSKSFAGMLTDLPWQDQRGVALIPRKVQQLPSWLASDVFVLAKELLAWYRVLQFRPVPCVQASA